MSLEAESFKRLRLAVRLARRGHAGQFRKGRLKEIYYCHPKRVCKAYLKYKFNSLDGAIACLCHDLVEDTELSLPDIEREFGPTVESLVDYLTKPPELPSLEYASLMNGWSLEAKKIKLCDIEDNIISSRQISPDRRERMLGKWLAFLSNLNEISVGSCEKTSEFLDKKRKVCELCRDELSTCNRLQEKSALLQNNQSTP